MNMTLAHRTCTWILGPILILGSHAVCATELVIHGKEAKHIYNSLTGSAVQNEGAAGHLYRQGKSILCRYTDVDITRHGKPVSAKSPCRYACSITFDANGLASPGPNP